MIDWSHKNYLILGLPEELNTGQVRLKKDENSTVGDAVEYITLRHSLLTGLDMKIQGMDYLVYGCHDRVRFSIEKIINNPLNRYTYVFTPTNLLCSLEKFKNFVLFDGTTKIL